MLAYSFHSSRESRIFFKCFPRHPYVSQRLEETEDESRKKRNKLRTTDQNKKLGNNAYSSVFPVPVGSVAA